MNERSSAVPMITTDLPSMENNTGGRPAFLTPRARALTEIQLGAGPGAFQRTCHGMCYSCPKLRLACLSVHSLETSGRMGLSAEMRMIKTCPQVSERADFRDPLHLPTCPSLRSTALAGWGLSLSLTFSTSAFVFFSLSLYLCLSVSQNGANKEGGVED